MPMFLNRNLKVITKPLVVGGSPMSVRGVMLGEYNPSHGGKAIFLPTNRHLSGKLIRGYQSNLTIGRTHGGRPRIELNDGNGPLYLALSSHLMIGEEGRGRLRYLRGQKPNFICRLCAMDRENPTISWDEVLVEAQPGDAWYATWSTKDRNDAMIYYVDEELRMHEILREDLPRYCREHQKMKLPFTIDVRQGEANTKLVKTEWVHV